MYAQGIRRRRSVVAFFCISLTVIGFLVALSASATHAAATMNPAAGEFVPLAATRVVNSAGNVGWTGMLQPGVTKSVQIAGVGSVANGAQAVLLHVDTKDGVDTDANAGYVWVYSSDLDDRPAGAAVVNSGDGVNSDNMIIVPIGADGKVNFYDGSSASAVNVVADIQGFVTSSTSSSAGASYMPLTQTRIEDTATDLNRSAPLSASSPWTLSLLGKAGLPSTASSISAVVLNVGAKNGSTNTNVEVDPAGAAANSASPKVHFYGAGSDASAAEQMVVTQLGTSGSITLSTPGSSVDVSIDVEGYYLSASASGAGNIYVPLDGPDRIVDTRAGIGIASGSLTAGQTLSGSTGVLVTGVDDVPAAGVNAVALSLTTLNTNAASGCGCVGDGYVEMWKDGTTRPAPLSTVNAIPQVAESNLTFQIPSSAGKVSVYNSTATTGDLLVDIEGYFQSAAAPSAPTDVRVAPLSTSAYVTWSDPDSDGNEPITQYQVQTTPATTTMYTSANSASVTGLTSGTTYSFQVSATNAIGTGSSTTASTDSFTSVAPSTVLDTANNVGVSGPIAAGQTLSSANDPADGISVFTSAIPTSGVDAVEVQATTSGASASGYEQIWTDLDDQPASSLHSVDIAAGAPTSQTSVVAPTSEGYVALYNAGASSNSKVEVIGYFAPSEDATNVTNSGVVADAHPLAPPVDDPVDNTDDYQALAQAQSYDSNIFCQTGTCTGAPENHYLHIHKIYAEGQGNGWKIYTCGPSAARNMLKNLTGRDYGEAQLATWIGTTTDGSSLEQIHNALKAHFPNKGSWARHRPGSVQALMDVVEADTYNNKHKRETIQNVNTGYLPFWHGHFTGHFDNSYGFDTGGSKYVYVAEEWDHQVQNTATGTYYAAPYGKHKVLASDLFAAIYYSIDHELI
jgi:hypothetical protein